MAHYNGTLLKRAAAFYKRFNSNDDKELYIIEPGYIVNKSAYFIWRKMDDTISYESLFETVKGKVKNASDDYLANILEDTIEKLYHRQLITIDGRLFDQSHYIISQSLAEKDMLSIYQTRPITQIDMVVTTACNFKCRHCYIKKENLAGCTSISVDAWKCTLRELCKWGLISISITGGEPLTYDGLPDILDYANDLGLKIQLLTNGYLIDEDFCKRIARYRKIIVQVSLDGSSAETSEMQRGSKGSFMRTVENIRLLSSYGIEVIVAIVLNKKNVNDIYDGSMVALCSELGVKVLGITPTVIEISNAADNKEMFLSPSDSYKAVCFVNAQNKNGAFPKNVIVNVSAPPALTVETSVSRVRKMRPRCRRGTNSFSVRPNGDVYVCTDFAEINYGEYFIGNVLTDRLEGIVNRLDDISTQKLESIKRIKGICSVCKELPYCWGACRADAFAKYKDINAPYPFCQSLYDAGLFPAEKINVDLPYREI